jgi:hypothetical protein
MAVDTIRLRKRWVTSWVVERLSASEEGPCSIELVACLCAPLPHQIWVQIAYPTGGTVEQEVTSKHSVLACCPAYCCFCCLLCWYPQSRPQWPRWQPQSRPWNNSHLLPNNHVCIPHCTSPVTFEISWSSVQTQWPWEPVSIILPLTCSTGAHDVTGCCSLCGPGEVTHRITGTVNPR